MKKILLSITSAALLLLNNNSYGSCSFSPPSGYTGHLNVQSKYDPNDPTRSKEVRPDSNSVAIQNRLNRYAYGISKISDYYITNHDQRKKDLAIDCYDLWLNSWADSNSLETQSASHTGKALRAWTLSSISTSTLTLIKATNNNWTPTSSQKAWLSKLADSVINDYQDRLITAPEKINNHDYWAAWSVAATGLFTENRRFLDWSYTVLIHSLYQVTPDAKSNTGYLPNEVGRGRLGVKYSHFAITPIVMLSSFLQKEGYVLHYEEQLRLKKLVDFTAEFTLSTASYSHLTNYSQHEVPYEMMSWLIPYNREYKNSDLAKDLETTINSSLNMIQLGGDINPLFPVSP